jgi:gamma-glutamylputrescine oxidase
VDRRTFLKGLGIGTGIVAAGSIIPAVVAETWGPDDPEVEDPRPLSFWEKDAGYLPQTPKLESARQTEVAIIGAGITGLSAALTLRQLQPELNLCVIDSHRPGSGASSRNSGHLVGEYHAWEKILSSLGSEAALEWNKFARRALEATLDFIRTNKIECHLRPEPLMHVGTESQARKLDKLAARMKKAGLGGLLRRGKRFQDRCGTSFYYGAIEDRNGYIMHPGKLMRGLLKLTQKRRIPIYEESPVLEVATSDSTTETNILKTPKGTVVARKILFATNAYTPRLGGRLSSRMIPIHVAIVATRPMTQSERSNAGFTWANLKEIQTLSRTIGLTPDNRVFLRGIFGYAAFNSCVWKDADRGYQRLEKEMRERLPWVKGLEVTEKWSGPVAMTASSVPLAGTLREPGQYLCAGYNGVGMVDGLYQGRLMAHQMIGADHPDLTYLKPPSSAGWIPPEPSRSLGAKAFFYLGL